MYIFGIVLVAISLVAVNCGTTSCLHGPSFWCDNEENAAKCGMTSYCATKVWANKVAPVVAVADSDTNACSLCYTVYNQLHMVYDAGADMNILDMLEETLCTNGYENCNKNIANIYKQIESFINSEDAQSACELFQLCSSSRVYIDVEHYMKLVTGFQCTGCQYIISEVKSAIGEISDEDLQKLMEQACESLDSSNEKECSSMATEYVDYVKTFIETLDGAELCTDFHMCNNDFVSLEQFKEEMKDIMANTIEVRANGEIIQGNNNNNNYKDNSNNINACSVCKIAISVAEMQLKVINLTLSTGNYVIAQICEMFGYDYCYKIQQIIVNVQSKLSTILDPTTVCETLNVCSGAEIRSSIMEPSFEVRQAQRIVKKYLDSFKK